MAGPCLSVVELQGVDSRAVEVRTYGDWVYEAGGWGIRLKGSSAGGALVYYRNRFGETYWIRFYAVCRGYASGLINPLMTLEELTVEIGKLYSTVVSCDWGNKMLMDIADLLPSKFRE